MVPLDAAEIDPMVATNAAYARTEIPAGTYHQRASAAPRFAPTATLVTSARTPPATVRILATAVLEALDVLRALHSAFAALEPAEMLGAELAAPLHEGVPRGLATAVDGGLLTDDSPD